MKLIYKITSLFFISLILILNFSINTRAIGEQVDDKFVEFTENTIFPNTRYAVSKEVTIKKDNRSIPESYTLYVRHGGKITIEKGAKLDTRGNIIIERGGEIHIKNGGTLSSYGALFNYGTITIEKGGIYNINGDFASNAESVLENKGAINFYKGNMQTTLSNISKRIKKYDKNFDINTFCINRSKNVVFFYYCIDNIKTNYYYKFELGKKLSKKNYPLNEVYNIANKNGITSAVNQFILKDELYQSYIHNNNYLGMDFGFNYNYNTKALSFEVNNGQVFTVESGSGVFFPVFDSREIDY